MLAGESRRGPNRGDCLDLASAELVAAFDFTPYGIIAPRPRSSVLDLAKIQATGFVVRDQAEALAAHLGVVAR